MSVDCFLDTNVLVYAVSSAEADAARRSGALDLVRHSDFGLSAQVLQEFYVTVTQKIRKPLAPERAVALMDEYRVFPTVPTDYPLIVAAAEALEAPILYTEDLNHGQRYGSVRVVNPFLETRAGPEEANPHQPDTHLLPHHRRDAPGGPKLALNVIR